MAIAPVLYAKPGYDPVKDFAPVTLVGNIPMVVVVHPSLPVKTMGELVALEKSKPGVISYASAGFGSTNHLAAELFKALAGVNIARVGYKGSGFAVNDLIGGQVQLMFATTGSIAPHVKSGRLRALAVTSPQPSPLAPGLPTWVDFVDLDSAKWTAYAQQHRWPLSWLYAREGRQLLRYERQVAAWARASFFVTEAECRLFREAACQSPAS